MKKLLTTFIFLFFFLFGQTYAFDNSAYASNSQNLDKIHKKANKAYQDKKYREALEAYNQGYKLNKKDKRFSEGILKTQEVILKNALKEHSDGKQKNATSGYNAILKAPQLDKHYTAIAKNNLKRAKNKKPPYQANNYIKDGKKLLESSKNLEALNLLTEGYSVFKDPKILPLLEEAGNKLLNAAIKKHRKVSFSSAIKDYNLINKHSFLSSELKKQAKALASLAQKKKKVFTAKEYIDKALAAKNDFDRLALYEEANLVYNTDKRFIDGILKTLKSIYDSSNASHRKGSLNLAIKGYARVIENPFTPQELKNEAVKLKKYAEKGRVLYTSNELVTRAQSLIQSNPYEALALFQDGLQLYPELSREILEEGIKNCGERIFIEAKKSHAEGSFSSATKGYETLLTIISYISDRIFAEAKINLDLAKKKIILDENRQYFTTYNVTLQEMINRQHQLVTPPVRSGKAGEPYWVKATPEEAAHFIDPTKILERNTIYQFMDLSQLSAVSVENLNEIITGKGILHNTGQVFKEAAIKYNVNEIYLINHAILETGHGTSQLANGVDYNKDGILVYNVFGIGAVDKAPIEMGAKRAFDEGWFSVEEAIMGGVKFISEKYINNKYKQNTLYKMRWNPGSPGIHQYATDIGWAEKQAKLMKNYFDNIKEPILTFDVPVFKL